VLGIDGRVQGNGLRAVLPLTIALLPKQHSTKHAISAQASGNGRY